MIVVLVSGLFIRFVSQSARGEGEIAELSRRINDLARSQREGLDDFGKMVADRLENTHSRVGLSVADAGRAVAEVRERLGQLGESTMRLGDLATRIAELEKMLTVPHARGAVGEIWLEQLIGQLLPEDLYETQYSFPSGERVDAVIRLGDRLVPIDAKFPLESWVRMRGLTGDERAREANVLDRSFRKRIDEVADKYIRPAEGTLDFALMYVPSEGVYYDAILRERDSNESLSTYALRRRVLPVSPHTFYAYVLALVHGLRGMKTDRDVEKLLAELDQIRDRFEQLDSSMDTTARHLGNAASQFEKARELVRDAHYAISRLGDVTPVLKVKEEGDPNEDA